VLERFANLQVGAIPKKLAAFFISIVVGPVVLSGGMAASGRRGNPAGEARSEQCDGGSRPSVLLDILDVEEILSSSFSVTRSGDLLKC
jgi:hypothetical protein